MTVGVRNDNVLWFSEPADLQPERGTNASHRMARTAPRSLQIPTNPGRQKMASAPAATPVLCMAYAALRIFCYVGTITWIGEAENEHRTTANPRRPPRQRCGKLCNGRSFLFCAVGGIENSAMNSHEGGVEDWDWRFLAALSEGSGKPGGPVVTCCAALGVCA